MVTGTSTKISATKVDEAPIVVPRSRKKGKRGHGNEVEKAVITKKQKVDRDEIIVVKNKKESISSSSDDESDSELKVLSNKTRTPTTNSVVPVKNSIKDVSSNSSDTSGSDSDDSNFQGKPTTRNNGTSSDASSSEESDSGSDGASSKEKGEKLAEADSTSSEGSSYDESSDNEPFKARPVKKVQGSDKSKDESSDEEESEEEEIEKQSLETQKEKQTEVEMIDAKKSAASTFQKTPKAPATPEAIGSKKLFVANLSFLVEEWHVREFFKEAGELVDVKLASNAEGQFKGFCHVEFATAQAAQKAMELHQQRLLGRPVRLNLARERGAFTPQSRENNSIQKGGNTQGRTAFVRGIDINLGVDKIKRALQEHFGSCGKIKRVYIPRDNESGGVKGTAYIDFANNNGLKSALMKDGSDLGGGHCLSVQGVKPKGDSVGVRFERGGRGGGKGGGREDGSFGVRGGRDGGRGRGRGRGTPYNKHSVTSAAMGVTAIASGKKTTFGDD